VYLSGLVLLADLSYLYYAVTLNTLDLTMTRRVVLTLLIKNLKRIVILYSMFMTLAGWPHDQALAQGQDVAAIASPTADSVVQGQVQIIGSADHPTFEFYVLDFAPSGTDGWQFLGDGRQVVINGPLATWNTAAVPDGTYRLRLRAVRLDGNYTEAFAENIKVSNSQPLPTPTPLVTPTLAIQGALTATVLPLLPDLPTTTVIPPTPTATVLIDQPIVETPTPRPSETPTGPALADPSEPTSRIPTVTGLSIFELQGAFIYGMGFMLSIFLLFGFFSALRLVIRGFMPQNKKPSFRK